MFASDDGSLYNGNKFKGFPPHQQGFFGNSGNIRKYIDNKKIYALDKLTAQEYRMHIHYQSCTASKTTFYIHLMFLHCMFVFHIHRTLCTLTGFASNIHMHGMGNFAHIMNDYTSTQRLMHTQLWDWAKFPSDFSWLVFLLDTSVIHHFLKNKYWYIHIPWSHLSILLAILKSHSRPDSWIPFISI